MLAAFTATLYLCMQSVDGTHCFGSICAGFLLLKPDDLFMDLAPTLLVSLNTSSYFAPKLYSTVAFFKVQINPAKCSSNEELRLTRWNQITA